MKQLKQFKQLNSTQKGKVSLILMTAFISVALTLMILMTWEYFHPKYLLEFNQKSVSRQELEKFGKVRDILDGYYYKKVDGNTLIEGAISGMANSLKDPYTQYYTREQMEERKDDLQGSMIGIGVIIKLDSSGVAYVVEFLEGSPAEAQGMMLDDKLLKVDGKDITGIHDISAIAKLIKGKENTSVKVTVYRSSQKKMLDLNIIRKKIESINIKSEVLAGGIGYISLSKFDSEIDRKFEEHLKKLLDQKIKGLVLDLRDNPGGYYRPAVNIADRLLPEGLIVYTEDRNGKGNKEYSDKKELEVPLAVLINGNSASASEVVSGAVKDRKKGILIGTQSFGKGLVQDEIVLPDGSGIKWTISRYFTPSGVSIHGVGIKPDIEVPVQSEFRDYPVSRIPREQDLQLKKAVEVLVGQSR